jgi:hypothetical protein
VAIAAVLRLQLVLSEKFDTVVRTTPEIEPYVPHDSLICAVLRYVERAASAVAFGYEKLNTYFELILMDPDVSFHAVATALHPGLRLNQFKSQWKRHPQWYNKAEKLIQKVFKQYVADEQEYEDL